MKTISFINAKGGVGKTTVADNTAYILGEMYGMRVLVIDIDKQGNTSQFFEVDKEDQRNLADVLVDESMENVIRKTKYKNIDVIPADMNLAAANMILLEDQDREQHSVLKRVLTKFADQYDFCIIDNAPDVNVSVLNGLVITDEVIIIANPDEYSLSGIKTMQEQIDLARLYNPNINFRGCLMNKFEKTHHSFLMKAKVKRNYPVFNTNIRFTKDRLNIITENKIPILEYSSRCGFSQDLKKFVKELLYIK